MQKSAFIKGLGVVVVIAAVLIVLPGNLLEIYSHTRFIVVPESMASSTTRIFLSASSNSCSISFDAHKKISLVDCFGNRRKIYDSIILSQFNIKVGVC